MHQAQPDPSRRCHKKTHIRHATQNVGSEQEKEHATKPSSGPEYIIYRYQTSVLFGRHATRAIEKPKTERLQATDGSYLKNREPLARNPACSRHELQHACQLLRLEPRHHLPEPLHDLARKKKKVTTTAAEAQKGAENN